MLRTSIFYVAAWIVAVNAVAIVPRDTATCPTICVDFVNECGMKYGGCVPHCEGEPLPTFTKPVCPTPTPCPTICVDGVNACGAMFGEFPMGRFEKSKLISLVL